MFNYSATDVKICLIKLYNWTV